MGVCIFKIQQAKNLSLCMLLLIKLYCDQEEIKNTWPSVQ